MKNVIKKNFKKELNELIKITNNNADNYDYFKGCRRMAKAFDNNNYNQSCDKVIDKKDYKKYLYTVIMESSHKNEVKLFIPMKNQHGQIIDYHYNTIEFETAEEKKEIINKLKELDINEIKKNIDGKELGENNFTLKIK
jgi:negative regulator of sigma E activity